MEFLSHGEKISLAIPASAEILGVTEKTIRNYIERGILRASKWNGSWRIPSDSLREVYRNKHGKDWAVPENRPLTPREAAPVSQEVPETLNLARTEYEALIRQASRLDSAVEDALRLRQESLQLNERIGRLEASSASGWTESRNSKEQIASLRKELTASVASSQKAQSLYGQVSGEAKSLREALRETRAQLARANSLKETAAAESILLQKEAGRLQADIKTLRGRLLAQGAR